MLCRCVFGYVPIEYPCFDQTFQADRLTGDVMNMHGVATVLCSLDGICHPLYRDLHTSWWQMIRRGPRWLGGAVPNGDRCFWAEALGLPSPTRACNPKAATWRLCLCRLPVLLVNEIL